MDVHLQLSYLTLCPIIFYERCTTVKVQQFHSVLFRDFSVVVFFILIIVSMNLDLSWKLTERHEMENWSLANSTN